LNHVGGAEIGRCSLVGSIRLETKNNSSRRLSICGGLCLPEIPLKPDAVTNCTTGAV
jgi:hypothetical protein